MIVNECSGYQTNPSDELYEECNQALGPTQPGVTRVQIIEPAFRATDYLWAGGKNVVAFLGQFAMVMFLVFFLLVTGDLFKRKLVKIAGPTLTKKKVTVQIMDDINQQISGFLRVQVLTSALVGVLTAIALWYFGVRQFIIWGILAGVFNSIPYLGPLIVTGGLGVVTFIQFDDLVKTSYICAITMAITSARIRTVPRRARATPSSRAPRAPSRAPTRDRIRP